jgi:hypothetical protein
MSPRIPRDRKPVDWPTIVISIIGVIGVIVIWWTR